MLKYTNIIVGLSMLFMLTACEEKESFDNKKSQTALIKTTNPPPVNLTDKNHGISTAQLVKGEVEAIEELYDVAVIEGEKKILVAYKVKHMERFAMKKIEKNLNDLLERKFSDKNFVVSSDYKIFLEAVRLKEDINDGELTKEEARERFKEILDLKEALT
ncbi:sporulation protein [Bacillus spongiae]|uniref:Sporulation protein n=1 Tax=Bacillus spongiae TaxID=2683610 RepID=A0ABU8HBJ7_9BACI